MALALAWLVVVTSGWLFCWAVWKFGLLERNTDHPLAVLATLAVAPTLAASAYFACRWGNTRDWELHAGWVVRAVWEEHWTERVTYTTTDKNGHTQTHTTYVYHPDHWYVEDSNGYSVGVTHSHFEELCRRFTAPGQKLNRHYAPGFHINQSSFGDGGEYTSRWDGRDESFTPCSTWHAYENRVRAAKDSAFHFQDPTPEEVREYGLVDRPEITGFYRAQYVHGSGVPGIPEAAAKLEVLNARWGKARELIVRVLVFDSRGPRTGELQEAYWQGGAKNEFVVMVGVSGGVPRWCRVASWTPEEKLKVDVKQHVMGLAKLDPVALVDYLAKEVPPRWKRKQFDDFAYISVPTPWWGWLGTATSWCLGLAASAAILGRNQIQ